MNKLIATGVLVASSFFSLQTSAATMECFVDTQAYDNYTADRCDAIVWGARTATAVFRITGTNKPINKVIWGDKATGCRQSGTSCSFTIRAFVPNKASATILYQDGTYDTASATASFEDGR
ncbi:MULTISPECIES: hypothetical protein [Shewanella]|uniref:hypothetical protein n=1 Tax=Shewanella TaxID=22 RepID=UPI0004B71BC5|nr:MULTISPECIES: hypothetical protein [Shewanella]QLE84220.1 hypothetical protein FLM48_03445 [Shewanella sp. Scap07]